MHILEYRLYSINYQYYILMALHLATRCSRYVLGKGLGKVFLAHKMIFQNILTFFSKSK